MDNSIRYPSLPISSVESSNPKLSPEPCRLKTSIENRHMDLHTRVATNASEIERFQVPQKRKKRHTKKTTLVKSDSVSSDNFKTTQQRDKII